MRPFVVMTGMHRSGTSFLARAFNLAGVYLGDTKDLITHDWKPHQSNKRGHWENQLILSAAENTLTFSGGKWHELPNQIRISDQISNQVINAISKIQEGGLLGAGFKETRVLLFFNEWKVFFPKNFILVGIFRHPLIVAESLKKRSNFSYEKSLHLWEKYNSNLLQYLNENNGILVDFDWKKARLHSELKQIFKKLNLFEEIDFEEWFSENLISSHNSCNWEYPIPKGVLSIHKKLKEKSESNVSFELDFSLEEEEKNLVIKRLLIQLHQQGVYFKKILREYNCL